MSALASSKILGIASLWLQVLVFGTLFAQTRALHSTAVLDAIRVLLDGEDGVSNFLDQCFEQRACYVSDSSREQRRQWTEIHRTFVLGEDIDALLRANASAFRSGLPLILTKDVDLLKIARDERGSWGRIPLASFTSSGQRAGPEHEKTIQKIKDSSDIAGHMRTVDHAAVHQAFADGFEVVIHKMEARSLSLLRSVEALSQFWMTSVTSSLHFVPPRLHRVPEHAPEVYAADCFFVQLDGELTVSLYPNAIPRSLPEHIQCSDVRSAALENLEISKVQTFQLVEGDVLYVPRGFGIDARTRSKISLSVRFAVETHRRTVADAIAKVIKHVGSIDDPKGESNPLRIPINNWQEGFSSPVDVTFVDILLLSVVVAAHSTSELRSFHPIGELLCEAMDEADVDAPIVTLKRHLESFLEAGQRALFRPMIEMIAAGSGWGELSRVFASQDDDQMKEQIEEWAAHLQSSQASDEFSRMEGAFRLCLQFVRQHRHEALSAAQREILSDELTRRKELHPWRLSQLAESLRKHGQHLGDAFDEKFTI